VVPLLARPLPSVVALGVVWSGWAVERSKAQGVEDGMQWQALDRSPILDLEQFMSLNDLAAVAVYAGGAGTPMQCDSGTGCGTVVFWSKN